jgi:hypothetical protein
LIANKRIDERSIKYRLLGGCVVILLFGTTALRGWITYFRYRPATPERFTLTSGVVSSLEKTTVGAKAKIYYIDIYLRNSPLRFRMRMNAFANSKAVLSEVKSGSSAEVTLWKGALASPSKTLFDSVPTVYVCGAKFDGRIYGTLEEYMAWRENTHKFGWLPPAFLSAMTAIFSWQVARFPRKLRAASNRESHSDSPELVRHLFGSTFKLTESS